MSLDVKCAKCGDGTCSGPLIMHGRCHITSPNQAILFGDKLTINCAECNKLIVIFMVGEIIIVEPAIYLRLVENILRGASDVISPMCHPDAGTWGYLHDQKDLTIQCAECDAPILKCVVLGLAPTGKA